MNIAIKNSLTMNKNGVSKRYAFFVSMYYASRILDVHNILAMEPMTLVIGVNGVYKIFINAS